MRRRNFGEFCDKKKRESIEQLRIIKQMLEKGGFRVDNFLETSSKDDPYIFCFSPSRNGSFDGVRIYKIGTSLAMRVQKEAKTHPYGSAYPLPIESMFSDFLSDEEVDQRQAGKKVMEAVVKEIRKFFETSVEAEKEERDKTIDQEKNSQGNIMVKTTGTDYSALVMSRG